ncbi:MAG: PaaI family thioesterase [Chloroflexi bacterium]|nr:PaaI family thioesterase [Chloroflexota bacterium]
MSDAHLELFEPFAATPYAAFLGIKLLELSPGYAKLSMVVRPSHLNFAQEVHGGVIMSFLDQAFACAVNSYGKLYVAVQFSTNLIGTADVGETIYAEGKVTHFGKTIGVCELTATDSRGKLIARATGTAAGIHNRKPTGEPIG